MPLDGLSSANTGIYRLITPIETTLHVEQSAKTMAEETIKKPEKSSKSNDSLQEDNEEIEREFYNKYNDDNQKESNQKKKEKTFKKYKVKFNSSNNMVELIDKKTGTIIETITPDDLISLISSSISPSGIFVDKKA